MKKNKKFILIFLAVLIFIGASLWLLGPRTSKMGDTKPWKPGYASPKQYYEENGQILKSTTKTIDGISYSFDDLGSAIQDENRGKWIDDAKYQLASGMELSDTWYEIDGKWHYFDHKGNSIKNRFIKVNDKKYFLNSKGELLIGPFSKRTHKFGTTRSGEIKINGAFLDEDGEYYATNFLGHGSKESTVAMELPPELQIMWQGTVYYQDTPSYFIEKEYSLVGETKQHLEGFPLQEGQSYGISLRSGIYTKNNESNVIYVLDKEDNTFYSYTPDSKPIQW